MKLNDFFCKNCGKPFDIADFVCVLFDNGEHFDLCKECQEAVFIEMEGLT
ncbi:MAG: hypothetical protein KAW12_10170 [Candidatus Aminicenantes bacterium]|nr:hypothetical protein [Candidatus Aminicenantes bacterium]